MGWSGARVTTTNSCLAGCTAVPGDSSSTCRPSRQRTLGPDDSSRPAHPVTPHKVWKAGQPGKALSDA